MQDDIKGTVEATEKPSNTLRLITDESDFF